VRAQCCKGLDVLLGRNSDRGGVVARDVIGVASKNVPGMTARTGSPSDAGAAFAQGAASGVDSTLPKTTYLVLHIDDPQGLVAQAKGSGVAWATMQLMPEFITGQIYSQVADELKKQFKEKGSTVSVDIVESPPKGTKPTTDLPGGIFLGVLLSAMGFGLVKLAGSITRTH